VNSAGTHGGRFDGGAAVDSDAPIDIAHLVLYRAMYFNGPFCGAGRIASKRSKNGRAAPKSVFERRECQRSSTARRSVRSCSLRSVRSADAAAGALAVAAGSLRGNRGVVRAGSVGLAAAVVVAGLDGAAPLATGLGALATLVAWDAATHALAVATQVGAAADDAVVLAHVRDGTLVGAAGLGVAAVAFLAGTGASALVAAVAAIAAIALVLALALD